MNDTTELDTTEVAGLPEHEHADTTVADPKGEYDPAWKRTIAGVLGTAIGLVVAYFIIQILPS